MGLFQSPPAAKAEAKVEAHKAKEEAKKVKDEIKKDAKKEVHKIVPSWTTVAPKGTLTISSLGSGNEISTARASTNWTFKHKRGPLLASVAVSDNSLRNVKTLRDVVLTADYKLRNGVTANAKLDVFSKTTTLGGTWDGTVSNKPSQLKFWLNDKDKVFNGEAKLALDNQTTALLSFNQERVLSAKYTIVQGPWTWEPSYNFVKETPTINATRRRGQDAYRIAYDLKAEQATLEYARKPVKLTLASKVSPDFKYTGKPTLTATYDNVYSF